MHQQFFSGHSPAVFKINNYRLKGVESNTSRLARCAWKYQIPVSAFIRNYFGNKSAGRSYFDFEVATHFNSYTDKTAEIENRMNQLTGRPLLSFHSYSFLNGILDSKATGFIAGRKKWCRACYKTRFKKPTSIDLANGVFDDLYWSVEVIQICMLHGWKLSSRCHHCKGLQPYVSTHIEPGYCHHCRRFLGDGNSYSVSEEELSRQQLLFHLFYISTFDELQPDFDRLVSNIRILIESICEFSGKSLCRLMGCSEDVIKNWLNGKRKPQLKTLFALQDVLGLSGVHQLFMDPDELVVKVARRKKLSLNFGARPILRDYQKRWDIEAYMRQMIEGRIETLSRLDLVQKFKVSEHYLVTQFPELCAKLSEAHRLRLLKEKEMGEEEFVIQVDKAFERLRSKRKRWVVENLVEELPEVVVEGRTHRELYIALGKAKQKLRESK